MKKQVNLFKKIIVAILIITIFCLVIFFSQYKLVETYENRVINNVEIIEDNDFLGRYVLTVNDVDVYIKNNGDLQKKGFISKNIALELENDGNDYYRVKNISNGGIDYYVKGKHLINIEELVSYDNRYKNYIVFNLNAVTVNNTLFYDEHDNLVYSLDVGYSLPIIINDGDRYGVEFANRLLYIKKDDCDVVESNNTNVDNVKGIGVLNYHFFYDDSIRTEVEDCNQEICASKTQFKMHLDYIKDNNFLTLKMSELEMYIDGKIRLPKSVVITIDDGWRADLGVNMLNEYQLNGTVFLVTSWYDSKSFVSEYVEVHSHSDNMHNVGDCPVGQGGGIQCLSKDVILNDLKLSSQKLGGTTVFCYPFYEYNDYSISVLKEAGYTMAFAGESRKSDNLVKVGIDKYKLPRFVVVDYTTMNNFKKYINGI